MSQVVWSDPHIARIVQQVCTRTGLFFRDSQQETVELGIRQAMQRAKQTSVAEYSHQIEHDARACDDLLMELTVGETYFFRDTGQMEFIRRNIVPEISARRGLTHAIRIWSAGCATGEEPYSLAMLCSEEGLADRTHILATDISRRSLERAHKAHYGEWSLRGDGASVARKHLRREGDRYHVAPAIRSRVQFEYLNLALDVYPSSVTGTRDLDLILCRNVLIYFDRDTIASVARRFYESLAPGGWVVTAAGDPSLDDHAPFETTITDSGLFYRRGKTVAKLSATVQSFASSSNNQSNDQSNNQSSFDNPYINSNANSPASVESQPLAPVAQPVTVAPAPSRDTLATAQQALNIGEYKLAAEIAARLPDTADSVAVRVQALANFDLRHAEQVCETAAKRHALSAHLQYLHAVLLLDLNREQEAVEAARRAVYLDNSLAIAHFTLGSVMRRLGDFDGARRSFRNARDLCDARPADEVVRFSDAEHAGTLARAAQLQLEGLN